MRPVWCALSCVLLTLAGCTSGGPSEEPLTSELQLAQLCNDGTTFPDAAAYTGEAPHPLALFDAPPGNGDDARVEAVPRPLQGERQDPYPGWDTSDPTAIQLVACAQRESEGDRVGECRFGSGPYVPVHAASYRVTVYEASTGKEVWTYTDGMDQVDCPAVAMTAAQQPKLFSRLTREQHMRRLVSLVGVVAPQPLGSTGTPGEGVVIGGDVTGAFGQAGSCVAPRFDEVPGASLEGYITLAGGQSFSDSLRFTIRPDQTVGPGSVQVAGLGFSFTDAARGSVLLESLPDGGWMLWFDGLQLVDVQGGSGRLTLDGSLRCPP